MRKGKWLIEKQHFKSIGIESLNSVRLINQSLKNQKYTPSGCEDIGIRKFEFVAKSHFLCDINM